MVERLYGVEHKAEIPGFLFNVEKPVCPSEELIRELSTLPRGTSVGVEFCKEFHRPSDFSERKFTLSNGEVMKITPASRYYWKKIIEVCEDFGLAVVFLDDFEIYRKCMEKRLEAETCRQQLLAFREQIKSGQLLSLDPEEHARAGLEAGYKADTEAEYLFQVQREEKILEKIRVYNPAVAIIGRGYGDFIMLNRGLLEVWRIPVKQYQREIFGFPDIDPLDLIGELDLHRKLPSYLTEDGPDSKVVLERELLQRRYNAVTQWRILPDKKPDFIGTWYLKIRTWGLFEMYVEKQEGIEISGTIEDIHGTARFAGEWDGQRICFIKTYDSENSMGQESKPIFYKGEFLNGQFQGCLRFSKLDRSGFSDDPLDIEPFILHKGDQFITDSPLNTPYTWEVK